MSGVAVLEPSPVERGRASSRVEVSDFEYSAQTVLITSGGTGGNHDLVRKAWPARLGEPPKRMVAGVPAHVDGRMLEITAAAGGAIVNPDRMWHYTEGLRNWDPIWDNHQQPGGVPLMAESSPYRSCRSKEHQLDTRSSL